MTGSPAPPSPGTFTMSFVAPSYSMWDGMPNPGLYYSQYSVDNSAPTVAGQSFLSPVQMLTDAPQVPLPPTVKSPIDQKYYNAVWSVLMGQPGFLYDAVFEDMMTASSSDWPGVYVPIYGYSVWEVNLAGSLVANGWVFGGTSIVSQNTSETPVTTVAAGPANDLISTPVTSP